MPLDFTLFSRSNCPLCEAMEEELRPFVSRYQLTIKHRYIDNEPELVQLYGDKVPVLTLDDETLCEYFLDSELLLNTINKSNH
jgi:thiol-disulfide isomerase/thioredoxin